MRQSWEGKGKKEEVVILSLAQSDVRATPFSSEHGSYLFVLDVFPSGGSYERRGREVRGRWEERREGWKKGGRWGEGRRERREGWKE